MPKILKNLFKTNAPKRRSLPVISAVSQFARTQLSRMAFLNQGVISMSMGR
jgi:hypothetical protein